MPGSPQNHMDPKIKSRMVQEKGFRSKSIRGIMKSFRTQGKFRIIMAAVMDTINECAIGVFLFGIINVRFLKSRVLIANLNEKPADQ